MGRVGLDGGPGHGHVRLARIRAGDAWRWADDWRVREGRLFRPGRDPLPLGADLRLGTETLELDGEGRVVARRRGARRTEILRDAQGTFSGMRDGAVSVRLEPGPTGTRGVASDGRVVTWREEGGAVRGFTDEHGVTTAYVEVAGRLAAIAWADGTGVRVEPVLGGIEARGAGGPWRCARATGDARVALSGPAGAAWVVEGRGDGETVTDPAGGVTTLLRARGRVVGWIDPRSGETRVERDGDGRPVAVTDPSGARWGLDWAPTRLGGLVEPDGARWSITGEATGPVSFQDPAGRSSSWEVDPSGRVRAVRQGAAVRTWARDADGRPSTLGEPNGARLQLRRDDAGRVVEVANGVGAWRIVRGPTGRVASVADPGGAAWTLGYDRLGRISSVEDPSGRKVTWTRRDDGGLAGVLMDGRQRWELRWSAAGMPSALRDPLGRVTGWTRDALGRARAVLRADGAVVDVVRDAAGDLTSVGSVRVTRDGAGRALGLSLPRGASVAWDRDAAGRVTGVSAPGVAILLTRGPGGELREVRVGDEVPVRLRRDGHGRVVAAEGGLGVEVRRDTAGRVVGLARVGAQPMILDRDLRGLVSRVSIGDDVWVYGRDAAGRVLSLEGPDGVRLGVDRDAAGRPRLVRFPGGGLARLQRAGDGVDIALEDDGGGVDGAAGWSTDPAGRVVRLRIEGAEGGGLALRRDPVGSLVTVEGAEEAWSWAPGQLEGPGGARLFYDELGRPREGTVPEALAPLWGAVTGAVGFVVGEQGELREVAGSRGGVRLRHDAAGRLTSWSGPAAQGTVERDAFGRLVRVGALGVEGWEVPLLVGGQPRAGLAGLALARPGGGVLLDPRGTPLLAVHMGLVTPSPGGLPDGAAAAAGEAGAGGRFQAFPGAPLLGLLDALDPFSGQPTGPSWAWPWSPPRWEALPGDGNWPDPDDAAVDVPWDPEPWAPTSPWSRPLDLLADLGELDRVEISAPPPGLPWLPASLAPHVPVGLPDPDGPALDEDPIVAWVLAVARPGAAPPEPEDLVSALLAEEVDTLVRVAPGLAPELPPGLYSNRKR